ncbi:MAG: DUF1552 domain-containing protein [Planctomycetota bacterium]
MFRRRTLLRGLAAGAGATLGGRFGFTSLPAWGDDAGRAAGPTSGAAKRVIFFLQNQGFDPKTCLPSGLSNGSLAQSKLPEPIAALSPYKSRLHILNGLHGRHTTPSHSAFFGALGGYRGSDGVPPSASTIDYEVSRALPQTLLPHLCIGMDSMENMKSKPTLATLSASGAGQPIFMYSNPNHLYQLLYGGIATGDIRKQHIARSNVFDQIESLAAAKGKGLPTGERQRYGQYVNGFTEMNSLRDRLDTVGEHLRKFAPPVDDRYANPTHETDWHDVLLDLGISALTSGMTNTLTIGSGRGEIFGAWKGLGIAQQGHNLGHMDQPDNPIWIKIRQYNCRMLVKIMQALESVPEGSGTMMDHTLIVYTSNNADKQHTNGANWPVMLLGDLDGALKTGRVTQLNGKRPINALYTSILRAAGVHCDRFNMDEKLAQQFDDSSGPLTEVLS